MSKVTTEISGNVIHINVGSSHLSFDAEKAHRAVRDYAEMHGWKQRLIDSIAGHMGTEQEKVADLRAMIDHYQSGAGEWKMTATTNGGDAVRAVMRAGKLNADGSVTPLTLDEAREKIELNAKKLGISPATMRTRLITLPGRVRDAYVAMLEERGVADKGEALLGDFS